MIINFSLYKNSKAEIFKKINSCAFKNIFLKNNITNVIAFTDDDFLSDNSEITIAILSNSPISFKEKLALSLEIDTYLNTDVDLLDLNDDLINKALKAQILNSNLVILKDSTLDSFFYTNFFYDKYDLKITTS